MDLSTVNCDLVEYLDPVIKDRTKWIQKVIRCRKISEFLSKSK